MKQSIFTITAVLIICAAAAAQPDTLWTKTFGGSDSDYGYCVQQTSDGGYIIAGTTGIGIAADVYLIKTDALGNQQWYQTFGGSSNDQGRSVQQTSDGGYIIAGYSYSFGGIPDVYLIKTDASGNQQWDQTLGGASEDKGYCVQQTFDGGYIIAGYTKSYGAGDEDVFIIKTDVMGNEQWNQTFGCSDQDKGYFVRQTNDNGFIITGYTRFYPSSDSCDVYLIKTDRNGNEEWSQTFGVGDNWDEGHCVNQTSDGGYIITGLINYGPDVDVLLLKTDQFGIEEWNQTFGGFSTDEGHSVQQTLDGGYILAGLTLSFGPGNVYLIKTDDSGNLQWQQTFGGDAGEYGESVQETSDGGYIIGGYTGSYGAGGYDVYLIRLESYIYFINPSQLNFIDTGIGSYNEEILTIFNSTISSAQITSISNSLPVFSFDSTAVGAVIPPGDSLEIGVTFTPDSSMQYTDTLFVEIEGVLLSAVLSGTGTGAYISLSEDTLDFGLWEPNAPYPTRNFTIENLGNDTLEVDSVISDNPAFILSGMAGLTLPPGETSDPITITFQPPGEGFHEGYILLPTNAYNVDDDTA
ncbi:choice-of-anchor D domain-containing protein, partial [bacterium]|nr:choice-of-anchor D domain-containing protein [bacterium]